MFTATPLMTRATIAKSLGFLAGIVGFVATRAVAPNADSLFAWGILGLFISIGGIVGIIGVIKRVPIFNIPLPPVVRGAVMGGWFTFLCVLFGYDMIGKAFQTISYLPEFMHNPFWMVFDGVVLGATIDVVASRLIKDVPDLFNA